LPSVFDGATSLNNGWSTVCAQALNIDEVQVLRLAEPHRDPDIDQEPGLA
jgi:hypothetical protein